jgi:hypothetical protein
MFSSFFTGIVGFFTSLPFTSATWFVIGILVFFSWIFYKAHRNPNSPVSWEDLIVDIDTSKTSPYKLGYLIGVVVGTWIVITFADNGKLTYDIFGIYLSFLLGGAGWAAFVQSKSSGSSSNSYTSRTSGNFNRRLDDVSEDELNNALPPNNKGQQ